MRRLTLHLPAPSDLGSGLLSVPPEAELTVDARLESVVEGVLASGSVTVPLQGECGRCLDPIDDELEVEFQELFAYVDSTTSETTEDEVASLDGDLLDLEPTLRDAIVLALPMSPLCQPDCPGLCAVCGERLEQLGDVHEHPVLDPRWAALQRLTLDDDPASDGRTGDDRTGDDGTAGDRTPDDGTPPDPAASR